MSSCLSLEHPLSVAPKALAFLQEISRDVPSIIVCNAAISACEKGVLQRGNQHLGVNSTARRDHLTNHDFQHPKENVMLETATDAHHILHMCLHLCHVVIGG